MSIPPKPKSEASVSTTKKAWGWGMDKQGKYWILFLICLTIWVYSDVSSICKDKGINYPFQEIKMNTYITKTWKTMNNQSVISVHPPLETIAFNH